MTHCEGSTHRSADWTPLAKRAAVDCFIKLQQWPKWSSVRERDWQRVREYIFRAKNRMKEIDIEYFSDGKSKKRHMLWSCHRITVGWPKCEIHWQEISSGFYMYLCKSLRHDSDHVQFTQRVHITLWQTGGGVVLMHQQFGQDLKSDTILLLSPENKTLAWVDASRLQ